MINIETIATDITSEQMSKCSKIIDCQTNEDFYICESSNGDNDYEVRYDAEKGFTCTCEAGMHGFANCKNYCWHVRAAVARRKEEVEAEKAVKHPLELPAIKISSTEKAMPAWAMNAKPAPHMRCATKER